MDRITPGARSRFGYLFGSAAAKPAPAAKAMARSAQPGPAARPATSKPEARPTNFSHLLKASRAHGVEMPAPVAKKPAAPSLGRQILELQARVRGEPAPAVTAYTGPEQPMREQPKRRQNGTSSLGSEIVALKKKYGVV